MKKRRREGKKSQINNFSKQKSKTRQKVKATIEANSVVVEAMIEEEVVAEDEEEAAVVDEDGVLITTSTISTKIWREQKVQHKAVEEVITTRDMISLKLNVIIAINLVIILASVELQITKSKRGSIMSNRKSRSMVHCY